MRDREPASRELIFLSGWFREEVVPASNTTSNNTSISEEAMQVILTKLEKLDYLEHIIQQQNVTVVPDPVTPAQIPETSVTKQAAVPFTFLTSLINLIN